MSSGLELGSVRTFSIVFYELFEYVLFSSLFLFFFKPTQITAHKKSTASNRHSFYGFQNIHFIIIATSSMHNSNGSNKNVWQDQFFFFKPQLEFISMNGDFSNATNVYLSKLGSFLPAFCFCCPSELFQSYFKHCLEFGMCNSKLKLSLISFIGQR